MPILRHELTLIARRQHVTLWRCVFAFGMAVLAGSIYYGASQDYRQFGRREVAEATQYASLALFGLLFMIGVMVTPQWTADAIAGERERQTLPFLLLTPLDGRSIVLGKLGSRLAQIGCFLLAGVPVLCALQFFGGVGPDLILIGVAALVATVVSIASLSVLVSVYYVSTKAAGQRAGQAVALYVVGLLLFGQLLRAYPVIGNFPSPSSPVTVYDLYDWVGVGNPIIAVHKLADAVGAGGDLIQAAVPVVRDYVVFHVLATVVCLTWASRRLRPVSAERGEGAPPTPRSKLKRTLPRPPVSDRRPVTWKMLYCDQRLTRTAFNLGIARALFVIGFAPLVIVMAVTLMFGSASDLPSAVNSVLRGVGTLILGVSFLHVAGQASVSVVRERLKQTLDELLLTDLTTAEILGQKWLAAILSARWFWVWIAIHWAVGVVTGGLHPFAIPLLMFACAVCTAAAASLGIYCTATCRSPRQANMWTIFLGAVVAGGPILVTVALLLMTQNPSESLWLPLTMSPPVTLGAGTFSWDEWAVVVGARSVTWSGVGATTIWSSIVYAIAGGLIGLALNGFLAWWWWRRACLLFPRTVGRK
jgi:ABC-type Na+ efflux pump permease subunit